MGELSKFGPIEAIAKFWSALSGTQKFMTVLFVSISVVLLLVVSVVATRPKMVVLFSGLESADAGAIVAKLQENKIPYEVDGSTIKVPEKNVHETRMQLAGQGLPQSSSVGFEIFDKNNLGMTEFSQRLNYQRALQGELCRTIEQIQGVSHVRVHIAVPEETVFAGEKKTPTASVVLKLAPGRPLDSDKVAGIVHLVSSAVEGMESNQVTVVDSAGNLLSQASDDPTGLDPRMSSSQLKLKREYERQVEQGIQSMLERALGPNKAIVRADAKVNFDRKETNSEIYQPVEGERGVLLSEDRMEESYNGGAAGTGGTVGVAAAIRNAGPTSTASGKGGYMRSQTTNKYEVSKTVERVITAPGQVDRVSIAVMVDDKVDASKIVSIQNAVTAAAGMDPARGDRVTVESIAFDSSAEKAIDNEMRKEASKATYLYIGKTVGAVILLLGFLFLLRQMFKQIKISVPEPLTTVEQVSVDDYPIVQGYDSPETQPERQEGAASLSNSQPEEIAKALRRWMTES